MQLPEFKKRRLFIYDFETNGFWNPYQPIRNQPIQVAIKVVEIDGTEHLYDSYIKCPYKLPKDVTDTTGITDEILSKQGKPIEDVFAEINKLLAVPDTLIIGHNTLDFDNKFLDYYLQKFNYDPLEHVWCYDTLGQFKGHLLQQPLGKYESFEVYHRNLIRAGGSTLNSTLVDLCLYYGIPLEDKLHNAIIDTNYTHLVFNQQIKDYMNLLPIKKDAFLTDKNKLFLLKKNQQGFKHIPLSYHKPYRKY